MQFTPTQLNLGTVLLGTQGSAQAITLPTLINTLGHSISGHHRGQRGDFTQTNNCGSSLPGKASLHHQCDLRAKGHRGSKCICIVD